MTNKRKNVVILTTSLVGAYDLDFTLLSRYYASQPVKEVPSLYVDLQLPTYDPKQDSQASLRLRLPTYDEDKESLSKISRFEIISPLDYNEQITKKFHQLNYLYHFDIEIHRHPPNLCTLFDVEVSPSSLTWKTLDSEVATCHSQHMTIPLSNDHLRPAEHVKILLLQGHLIVNNINLNLPIRVEYGCNSDEFSLIVPVGFGANIVHERIQRPFYSYV